MLEQHHDCLRDGLQLKGDVGQQADHCHERDNRSHGGVLAISGRDEVGDRGDVLRFRQQRYSPQQRQGERKGKDRTDIDRDEIEPFIRGGAHTSEECPRCTVDTESKGINIGASHRRRTLPSGAVAKIGDAKEGADIQQGTDYYDPAVVHALLVSGSLTGSVIG